MATEPPLRPLGGAHVLIAGIVRDCAGTLKGTVEALSAAFATAGRIEVQSALGGLGLYRRDTFVAGTYAGLDPSGHRVCEHVAFHRDLVDAGFRLFINPRLINGGRNEHSDLGSRRRQRMAGQLKKLLRKVKRRLGGMF